MNTRNLFLLFILKLSWNFAKIKYVLQHFYLHIKCTLIGSKIGSVCKLNCDQTCKMFHDTKAEKLQYCTCNYPPQDSNKKLYYNLEKGIFPIAVLLLSKTNAI